MENKDLSGALFSNADKSKDTHPDFKGSVIVNDVKYWVAGWKRKAKKTGLGYVSLALEEAEEQPEPKKKPAKKAKPSKSKKSKKDEDDEEEDAFEMD